MLMWHRTQCHWYSCLIVLQSSLPQHTGYIYHGDIVRWRSVQKKGLREGSKGCPIQFLDVKYENQKFFLNTSCYQERSWQCHETESSQQHCSLSGNSFLQSSEEHPALPSLRWDVNCCMVPLYLDGCYWCYLVYFKGLVIALYFLLHCNIIV